MNVILRDCDNYGRVVDYWEDLTIEEVPKSVIEATARGRYEFEETERCYTKKYEKWWETDCECVQKDAVVQKS